jgi:4-hydroxybenzoate polyprenyltransferase
MLKFISTFYFLLVSLRPRQWLKNFSVFAAIFFGGRLLEINSLETVSLVFLAFCLQSSSVYLINDVLDIKADQIHFSKKERPIAKGSVPKTIALITSVVLSISSLVLSYQINDLVFISNLLFLIIQVFYSLYLKQVILFDILAISLTFMLRVFAGSFAIDEPLSSWLILTVMMLSLFLAIGKRRSEVTLLSFQQAVEHRKILSHYPINLLDGLVFMMATSSLLTYSLFSFNTGKATVTNFLGDFLPTTLSNPRWLMLTIPFVVYGIFRYLYLIFEKKEGESPEKVLLTDTPLFICVSLFLLLSFVVIYVFGA